MNSTETLDRKLVISEVLFRASQILQLFPKRESSIFKQSEKLGHSYDPEHCQLCALEELAKWRRRLDY